ncbi:hypothetical protein F5Y17DRAFT_344471 [Xylariaceae sp. FL0594]|nr:hypothetical protein F5Y17DRAFT_344471 [Xylariaceae sp. FL0594]
MFTYHQPMPPSNTRKRPAPGSIPIQQQQQPMSQPYNSSEQMMSWSGNNAGNFADNVPAPVNPYAMLSPNQPQFSQGASTPSTVLARRPGNSSLITSNRTFSPQPSDAWPAFGDDGLLSNPPNASLDEHDNIELLEEKAQRAKREAQAKRKQIPPFVQKLNRCVLLWSSVSTVLETPGER